MTVARVVALEVSLILAAGICADCAYASTVTIHSGNTIHVNVPTTHVNAPTTRNSRVIQSRASASGRRGHGGRFHCEFPMTCERGLVVLNPDAGVFSDPYAYSVHVGSQPGPYSYSTHVGSQPTDSYAYSVHVGSQPTDSYNYSVHVGSQPTGQ